MLKKILCAFLSVLVLSGCGGNTEQDAKTANYRSYFDSIIQNTEYITESDCYSLSAEMTSAEDGSYRYYLVIDQPLIAMYDVVVMAVENDTTFELTDKMMPSIGIFDGPYCLIPNQVNSEAGYVKGLVISGSCTEQSITLKIMVEWKDKDKGNIKREFRHVVLSPDGMVSA